MPEPAFDFGSTSSSSSSSSSTGSSPFSAFSSPPASPPALSCASQKKICCSSAQASALAAPAVAMDLLDLCSPMAPEHLSSFLGPDTVFVDVRPEDSFHRAHLRGALPLTLPTVLWKRFKRNRATPGALHRHLLSEALAPLKSLPADVMLVLYDESSASLASLTEETPLRVFCEYFALMKFNVCFIEGGFRAAKGPLASQVVASEFGGLPVVVGSLQQQQQQQQQQQCQQQEEGVEALGRKRAAPTAELSWIHGFLAVGSEKHAHDVPLLKSEGVTHILNLTNNPVLPEAQREFKTLQLELRDTLSENLLAHLQTALEFIETARGSRGRILVHCFAGVSRSVSVCVAYAMWAFDMTLDDAMLLIKTHRECASPNLNFIGQLMMFEQTLGRCPSSAAAVAGACSSPNLAPASASASAPASATGPALVALNVCFGSPSTCATAASLTTTTATPSLESAPTTRRPLSPQPSLHAACTTALARLNGAISIHA